MPHPDGDEAESACSSMVSSNHEVDAASHRPDPPYPTGLLATSVANLIHGDPDAHPIIETQPRDPDAPIVRKLDDVAGAQTDAPALAAAIRGIRGWTRIALGIGMLVACGAGVLAGMGSLEVEGERPVNIFWLLGAVLGGQTVLLAIWLLLLLFGGAVLRRWSIGGLLLGTAGWISSRMSLRSTARDSDRHRQGRAAAAAVAETDFGGARSRWALGCVTNLAWLAFNVGLLGALIGVLSVRQFDFGWETTIGSDAFFEEAAQAISIAPEWVGFNVPDQAEVKAARIDPSTGALAGAGDEARKAFSGLLMGSVVLYGLAPRLLLLLFCLMVWSGLRRSWRPEVEGTRFAPLRRLTEPQAVRVEAIELVDGDPGPDADEAPPPPDRQSIGSAIVGIELDTPSCGWPPPSGAPADDLGMVESREDRIATVQRLRHATTLPARLVVVVDMSTTPDRGIARSIELIHEAAEQPVLVVVVTGGERFRTRVDSDALERRSEDWRGLVGRLEVGGHLHEIDLDNLTATTRAQLSEAVSGSARPNLPIERGPISTIDAAFAEIGSQMRRWHGAPSDKERLALHKAVARCAGAETGGNLWTLPGTEDLMQDPRETITRAGRNVLQLLPDRLLASGRWAAVGGTVGALACLATAGTVAPAVLAALPVWLATGAASGAGIAALADEPTAEIVDTRSEAEARGEAIAGAALHAVILTFQGRGERHIQEIMEQVFTEDPPALPDMESATHALSKWRSRIVIASHESRTT
ncbi:MAG: DUF2868 domain-containing protein [Phycisphaerales bacterium]|nr:DUF2868 domain-containing protein [Phycisphaerales bacterium]